MTFFFFLIIYDFNELDNKKEYLFRNKYYELNVYSLKSMKIYTDKPLCNISTKGLC